MGGRVPPRVIMEDVMEMLLTLAFGIALAVFVATRLNSGLNREERKELTSTSADH